MPSDPSPALSGRIEQWLLSPGLLRSELESACIRARRFFCAAVCVHGSNVLQVRHYLDDTDVAVTAAVGFPHGASDADVKRYETEVAIDHGAHEINLALPIARLGEADQNQVVREIRDVVEAADERPVKVVLEMSLLDRAEVVRVCTWITDAGAHAVVLSAHGATAQLPPEEVSLIRETLSPRLALMAACAIANVGEAVGLLDAGATRVCVEQDQTLWQSLETAAHLRDATDRGQSGS